MLKLVILAGLLVVIAILAARHEIVEMATARLETATPQHLYLRLHNDDELVAKP
jgi:hypothetical protein